MSDQLPEIKTSEAAPAMSPARRAAMLDAVRHELRESRPPMAWWAAAALAIGVQLSIGAAATAAMTKGEIHNPSASGTVMAIALLLVLVQLAASFAALAPERRTSRIALACAGGVLAALIPIAGNAVSPAVDFWRAGMACGITELAVSFVPLVLWLVWLTRFAADPLRTAIAALAAGATGQFALHLHCRSGDPSHLLVFHVGAWALAVGVAVVLRQRLPSRSHAP